MKLRRALILSLLLSAACALPASTWETGISYTVSPSPLYNWTWSPALDGMGIAWDLRLGPPSLYAQTGLDARIGGIGAELLLPIGVGKTFRHNRHQRVDGAAGAIVGMGLFYPAPLITVGGFARATWSWFWSSHWGLSGSISIRYLTSPQYSAQVAPYQVLDLPISVGLRYRPSP